MCAWIKITVGDFTNPSLYPNGILFVLLNRFVFIVGFQTTIFLDTPAPLVLADFPLFSYYNFKSFFEDVNKNSCFSVPIITEKASIF